MAGDDIPERLKTVVCDTGADLLDLMREFRNPSVTAMSKVVGYVKVPGGRTVEIQLTLEADENCWTGEGVV